MGKSPGITAVQRRTLDQLKQIPELAGFYLAGGTAIGAQLGHRQSLDLDLFSVKANADIARIQRSIVRAIPATTVLSASDVALSLRVHGALVDIVCYPYAPIARPISGPQGFATAALLDLAAMKLSAVSRRGIRRDFWDLYVIVTVGNISLRTMARAYVKKFAVGEADLYAVLRSLTYFVDADADPIWPKGLTVKKWREIVAFFETNAPRLVVAARKPSPQKRR